ncbi:MAG: hypothetical protein LBQ47_02825 [Endomicrobium sp.]|jgi:hypothetical protein|nr:hypothetical protein [Endomicrobium sp.]
MSKALTGKDSIIILGRPLADLADGDNLTITFPNDIAAVKTGKNGNSLFASNETGDNADVAMRIVLGSADDKFLNNLLENQKKDLASFTLLDGSYVKKVGDGSGNITDINYTLSGGVFIKRTETKSNAEADTEQAVVSYSLRFAKATKAIS